MYTDVHEAERSVLKGSENMAEAWRYRAWIAWSTAENGTDPVATYAALGPDADMVPGRMRARTPANSPSAAVASSPS